MLDLHNHLLPGVDDGPTTFEESVAIARMCYLDGTRTIVASPHSRDVTERSSISNVRSILNKLQSALDSHSIPIRLIFGMENHIELNTPEQVKTGKHLPIGTTRFILIELPFEFYPFYTDDVIWKLHLAGLIPIIVHPERNRIIQHDPEILYSLIQKGALSQITAGSITGTLGLNCNEAAKNLLRVNLVHLIASDTHAVAGIRKPDLADGVEAAGAIVGHTKAMKMVHDIPRDILEDKLPNLSIIT